MNTKQWQEFAEHIQGEFVKKSFWHTSKVEKNYKGNRIVFENYTTGDETSQTCTKVTAFLYLKKDFIFQVYNSNFFTTIAKYFGMQDILIGSPDFDKKYIVKSNDGFKIKQLLRTPEVRNEIENFKYIYITLSKSKTFWNRKAPENLYELCYNTHKDIKDFKELETIYHLLTVVINQLQEMHLIEDIKQ